MRQKPKRKKSRMSTALISLLIIGLLSATTTFFAANAAENTENKVSGSDVSASDTVFEVKSEDDDLPEIVYSLPDGIGEPQIVLGAQSFYVKSASPIYVKGTKNTDESILLFQEPNENGGYDIWCGDYELDEDGLEYDGIKGDAQVYSESPITYFGSSVYETFDVTINSNADLRVIDCDGSWLINLTINGNDNLEEIRLGGCYITSLDVSGHSKLKELVCDRSPLTSIDLSGCTGLTFLDLSSSNITSLDLSDCTSLVDLYCGSSQIRFSTLKLWDSWENIESQLSDDPELLGQRYIYDSDKVPAGATIDLSSEYDIDGNITDYTWYVFNELEIYVEEYLGEIYYYEYPADEPVETTPSTSSNGQFTFDESFVGKYVYCKMTNKDFIPSEVMDLETSYIQITDSNCKHSKTQIVGKKAATCTEEGYTGDKVCTNCGKTITPGTVIPKIAHKYGKYVNNNDATCMKNATKTATCAKCGETVTVEIPDSKTPHTYGACTSVDEHTHTHTCTVEGCGHVEELPHRGGTATYTEQAVCMDCGRSYGELLPHEIKLNVESINLLKDKTFSVDAYKYPADSIKSVTWTSSNTAIATVDQNGVITAAAKGKAVVTATIGGECSASVTVNVIDTWKKPTDSITIKQSACTLTIQRNKLNPTVTLSATVKGNGTGKQWYSDNINVATVNKGGKVTAVSAGTANIYCTTASGEVSDACVITVNEYRIDSDNMHNNIVYVNAGSTCNVNLANTTSDNSAITWKSSNTKIASIDENGVVTAYKKGTVTITVTSANKGKDTVKLTVVDPTEALKISKSTADIYVGKTVSLKATVTTRGSNDPVFWTSSNSSIATVSDKGVVKGLKQGKVTITATSFNGEKIAAEITVRTKATALEFTDITPALYMDGKTGSFTVKIAAPVNSNDTIKWTTSNKKVVDITSISADGKTITIKSGAKGTANITAKAGSGKSISYKVTVVNFAARDMSVTPENASIYVGKTATLKYKITDADKGCNDIIIWSSSDPTVATVDQNGKVTAKAQGTATISADSFGGNVHKTVQITVRTRATAITADQTAVTVNVGGTAEVNVASIAPEGCNDTLTWTTSSKSIATVAPSADGSSATITGVKKGTATVTVKTGSGKSAKIKVTVTQ